MLWNKKACSPSQTWSIRKSLATRFSFVYKRLRSALQGHNTAIGRLKNDSLIKISGVVRFFVLTISYEVSICPWIVKVIGKFIFLPKIIANCFLMKQIISFGSFYSICSLRDGFRISSLAFSSTKQLPFNGAALPKRGGILHNAH